MIDAAKEVFSNAIDWVYRNAILLLFSFGFFSLAASFFIRSGFVAPDSTAIAGLIKIIASAAISGGFFAWLTKVAQDRKSFV